MKYGSVAVGPHSRCGAIWADAEAGAAATLPKEERIKIINRFLLSAAEEEIEKYERPILRFRSKSRPHPPPPFLKSTDS